MRPIRRRSPEEAEVKVNRAHDWRQVQNPSWNGIGRNRVGLVLAEEELD